MKFGPTRTTVGNTAIAGPYPAMQQPIIDYHRDDEGHWVAELACGHNQHVRHQPPWTEQPWVITEAGRRSRLGLLLECVKCDRDEPRDNALPQKPLPQ